MTEMVFAGTSIGPKGVQPDLKKLTAIVNWKIPENATALAGFLGLTGWFKTSSQDTQRRNNYCKIY